MQEQEEDLTSSQVCDEKEEPVVSHPREHLLHGIVLGSGGVIANVKKNEHLLRQIAETQPLAADVLLNLAAFYRPNPALRVFADQLILASASAKGGLEEVMDELDDAFHGSGDAEDQAEKKNRNNPNRQQIIITRSIDIRWVLFQGIGILVETDKVPDMEHFLHTPIGFSPNPEDL